MGDEHQREPEKVLVTSELGRVKGHSQRLQTHEEHVQNWRIGCVIIPDFSVQLALKSQPKDRRTGPFVLVEKSAQTMVRAANADARAYGIYPGQTLNQARSKCTELSYLWWQDESLRDGINDLLVGLNRAAPSVQILSGVPGAFWFDARGVRLLGGEAGIAHTLQKCISQYGFEDVRIGFADSLIAARAAAQCTDDKAPIRILTKGEDSEFIKTLSLDQVPLDSMMRSALEGLGLRDMSEVFKLPSKTLLHRFGSEGLWPSKWVDGQDYRRPSVIEVSPLFEVKWPLEHPVESAENLLFVVKALTDSLGNSLGEQNRALSSLVMVLMLDDGSTVEQRLYPARPTHHSAALFELIRDRLDQGILKDLSSPIIEVELRAAEHLPAAGIQGHFGTEKWSTEALARMLDRLQGRFEEPVVFHALARSDSRYEHVGQWVAVVEVNENDPPFTNLDTASPQQTSLLIDTPEFAPIRRALNSPQPIKVRRREFDASTEIFWQSRWQAIEIHGPERFSGRWWSNESFAHEDFRGHLLNGEILWLRREADTQCWWVRGWFD